jgi:hypothetical protein
MAAAHEPPVTQIPLNDAEPLLGPQVYATLARYGFSTLEEIAAVPDLGLLNIRHFGPNTRLVVDAVLAAYRLVDDPGIRAAQQRHHLNGRLSAAHRAHNAPLLDLLAISDLEIGAVDTIAESLAAGLVPALLGGPAQRFAEQGSPGAERQRRPMQRPTGPWWSRGWPAPRRTPTG